MSLASTVFAKAPAVFAALSTAGTSGEADLEHAWHRDVDTGDDHVFRRRVIRPYGLSVRCVLSWSEADDPREATGDGGTR